MAVSKSKVGVIHVIATCNDCGKQWEDYRTAVAQGRRHAESTGHSVHVDQGRVWTYNPKKGRS